MGKNPSIIIKEQAAKAKKKRDMIASVEHTGESVLEKASKKYGQPCGFYEDLIKAFMIEGYPTKRAEKHISEWADRDILDIFWMDGYHVVAYDRGAL